MIQRYLATCAVIFFAASSASSDVPAAAVNAEVVILGELHDNSTHHEAQQTYLKAVAPTAVVFEMLLPSEAAQLQDIARTSEAMRNATTGFHWSNMADYAGVLSSSKTIIGAALSRDMVRTAFDKDAASVFGDEAQAYGLSDALDPAEKAQREALQFAAHCEAMPLNLMAGMVEAQRLRDAHFARTVLQALDTHGAPIVLITGNGHARKDWGVPAYIARVRPKLDVFTLGQFEVAGSGDAFDAVSVTSASEREDPCAAFR